MHTEYYTRPRLQRHVIRILWMVPIYSLDAWLALRFKDARAYIDPVREIYEAYVIYNFYAYLINYLEDELGVVDEHLAKKTQLQHLAPFNHCVKPWRMGAEFIWETKKVSCVCVLAPELPAGPGLSVCLSACLSVCLFAVCLSACLPACLSVCLSFCLSICLFVSLVHNCFEPHLIHMCTGCHIVCHYSPSLYCACTADGPAGAVRGGSLEP
jgi:Organic solute transporter Ostalpha